MEIFNCISFYERLAAATMVGVFTARMAPFRHTVDATITTVAANVIDGIRGKDSCFHT